MDWRLAGNIIIRSYSQFVLRINYMLLYMYSITKYDEEHAVGQAR